VEKKVIPVIIGATGTISKTFRKRPEQHSAKERSRGTAKNSHGWLRTHTSESTEHLAWEITLNVAQIVNTEQVRHYIPYKCGLFQYVNVKRR